MKTPWRFDRCALDRVIDGDSFRLEIDTGFHHSANICVRLLGVDTPERGRDPEQWRLAREYVDGWFATAGKFVFECHGPDKYGGRWLGRIISEHGLSLSANLIESGLGVYYDGGRKAITASP